MVKLLLEARGVLDAKNDYFVINGLANAVRNRDEAVVKLLLKAGADGGDWALRWAA